MQEGRLMNDISTGTKSWASKVASSTSKGWKDFTNIFTDNPTTLDSVDTAPTAESLLMPGKEDSEKRERLRTPDETDDVSWGWGNSDTWDNTPQSRPSPPKVEENDSWDSWSNEQDDLLLDFGDSSSKPKKANSATRKNGSKKSSSSNKKVTSLEETWDDAGGWDEAAWDAIESDINTSKKTSSTRRNDSKRD